MAVRELMATVSFDLCDLHVLGHGETLMMSGRHLCKRPGEAVRTLLHAAGLFGVAEFRSAAKRKAPTPRKQGAEAHARPVVERAEAGPALECSPHGRPGQDRLHPFRPQRLPVCYQSPEWDVGTNFDTRPW
jgi:hypothetical protein